MKRCFCFALLLFFVVCLVAGCGGKSSWRQGGVAGTRPYTVRGKTYYPLKSARGFIEEGEASWYGPGFDGRSTASGERYDQDEMTAAHKLLPFGSEVRVTHLDSGASVTVRINDRGPFFEDRVIDLSHAAALRLKLIRKGTGRVRIQSLEGLSAPDTEKKATPSIFYVQVGSFVDKDAAQTLIRTLTLAGYRGRLLQGSNEAWNVQVGPCSNITEAQKYQRSFLRQHPGASVLREGTL